MLSWGGETEFESGQPVPPDKKKSTDRSAWGPSTPCCSGFLSQESPHCCCSAPHSRSTINPTGHHCAPVLMLNFDADRAVACRVVPPGGDCLEARGASTRWPACSLRLQQGCSLCLTNEHCNGNEGDAKPTLDAKHGVKPHLLGGAKFHTVGAQTLLDTEGGPNHKSDQRCKGGDWAAGRGLPTCYCGRDQRYW